MPPVPIQTISATLRSISSHAMKVQITITATVAMRLMASTRRSTSASLRRF